MGSFYTSFTLRGPTQEAVASALAGRSAWVTASRDNVVVAYDEECEEQNGEIIAELGSRLSGQLRCAVMAALNHDDDILSYELYLSGELVDDYNSAPNYFEGEPVGPEGGNARKLCEAFGSAAVTDVDEILRAEDGYAFARERHTDLLGALGLPSFAACGYEYVTMGEFDEDLSADELIDTKDWPMGPPVEDVWRRPVPGYYKVSFRTNPKLVRSIPVGLMPRFWEDLECQEDALSPTFHRATAQARRQLMELGFIEIGFKRITDALMAFGRESGGINFVNESRTHYGQINYCRFVKPPSRMEEEQITIAFTAVCGNETFSCTNRFEPHSPVPKHNVVRVQSVDAGFIHGQFVELLKSRPEPPVPFPDLASLKAWFNAARWEVFEHRVRQGEFVRMSTYEVEKVRRSLPAAGNQH